MITNVEFSVENTEYDEFTYRIYVLAYDERINVLTVSGDDGNGWYGTGYEIYVKFPKEAK